jgi:hypothetical protein
VKPGDHWLRHTPNAIFWIAVVIGLAGLVLPFFWAL